MLAFQLHKNLENVNLYCKHCEPKAHIELDIGKRPTLFQGYGSIHTLVDLTPLSLA